MDTSDGLIATLDQLARLNGLGIVVERPAEDLLDDRADRTRKLLGLPALSLLAAHHGEFELVLAVQPPRTAEFERAVADAGETVHRVGRFVTEPGLRFGSRTLDTSRIRNLAFTWGGDSAMYVRHLMELVG